MQDVENKIMPGVNIFFITYIAYNNKDFPDII